MCTSICSRNEKCPPETDTPEQAQQTNRNYRITNEANRQAKNSAKWQEDHEYIGYMVCRRRPRERRYDKTWL